MKKKLNDMQERGSALRAVLINTLAECDEDNEEIKRLLAHVDAVMLKYKDLDIEKLIKQSE